VDNISENLGRLAELNDDEVTALETSVLAEFDTVEALDRTPETVDQMTQLADALDAVKIEKDRRVTEAAELSRRADEAASRVRGNVETETSPEAVAEEAPAEAEAVVEEEEAIAASAETPEAPTPPPVEEEAVPAEEVVEPEPVVEEVPAEEPVVEEEPEPAVEVQDAEPVTVVESVEEADEQEELPVTASIESPEPVIEAPSDHAPRVQIVEAPQTITAGADFKGYAAGATLPDLKTVAEAMVERLKRMGSVTGNDGEQVIVASIQTEFPEDRTLRAGDVEANRAKVEAVISPEAITAAGGLCAPVNTRYEIFGVGSSARPVRDSLVPFNADRGGIRFITPPIISDLDGAASIWTLQDDIDASTDGSPDPVKPCIRVACGDEVVVYLDAFPLCLTFGNMGARAYPEMVERHMELALVSYARYTETRLLTRIGSLSTAVSAARQLGAAVDFLVQVDKAAAGYRNRHRMEWETTLRVIAPEWFMRELTADMAKRMPGDGLDGNLAVAKGEIDSWFSARNIVVTWTLDGETGQVMGTQAAGALNGFPATLVWYMFAEGTFLLLDGGTLDIGLVRDSTLNGTNDYKQFQEEFTAVAKVGVESLRVTSALVASGQAAGLVDTTNGN
jgi:hypothetical protein